MRSCIVLGCLAAGSACDLSGIVDIGDDLLDPDAALLDRPGRRIVAGSYSGLKIAGSAEGGGYVLARRDDASDARLAVVPFLEGEPCEYAPAFEYDRFSSRIDIELPGTLSVQVDQDEGNPNFGTVRFIDYECREVIDEIPSTVLPGPLFPSESPTGMLARSSDGTLYLIDAERRTRTSVAPDVDYGVVSGTFLFTLESGEVVIRDEDLDVVDRVGSGAFSLVATGGDRLPIVYEDETGVHGWSEADGASSLAEDGCYLWFTEVDSIAYFDPCDERRIALVMPKDAVFDDADAESFVTLRGPRDAIMDSFVIAPGVPTATTTLPDIAVVTNAAVGVPNGTLHSLTLPEDTDPDADEIELSDLELDDNVTFVPAHRLYYRDYADGRGTLLDFRRDDDDRVTGLIDVAENVAWVPYGNPYSYRGLLADYDGREGRLMRVVPSSDDSLSRTMLGEGVPLQNFVGDPETGLVAYVSDLNDEGSGTLNIIDEFGPFEAAEGALVNEIRALDDPRGVIFLHRAKSEDTFELHVWLVEAELDLLVHDTVSEYLSIPWPSPGILYSVPDGDDAGLWFAKAR